MLENIAFLPTKREKNHPIINIVSGGRGELARCPDLFVRDCLKKKLKNVTQLAVTESQSGKECTVLCVLETHTANKESKKMDRNPPNKILEVTFWPPLFTVAHNCHGKIFLLTAKSISPRQNQLHHSKINFGAAKSTSSQQNQFRHSKINFTNAKSI